MLLLMMLMMLSLLHLQTVACWQSSFIPTRQPRCGLHTWRICGCIVGAAFVSFSNAQPPAPDTGAWRPYVLSRRGRGPLLQWDCVR